MEQPGTADDDRPRERVTGLGGVFFRTRDPDRIRNWYAKHLGLEIDPSSGTATLGTDNGSTVWAPIDEASYLGPPHQEMLVSYRVSNLDAMLAQLRADGVSLVDSVEESEDGRFGWAYDLDGSRFELWEPPGARQ